MSKMRVYEYAKKFNISSKDVITKLKDMNVEVSNHMTTLEEDSVKKLDKIYNKETKNTQNKPEQNNPSKNIADKYEEES
ncbi:MAG: translation initiation factor IF-2 N-terminal domain-containing protein, partial [Bacillus sp. (in: firmicutes)]